MDNFDMLDNFDLQDRKYNCSFLYGLMRTKHWGWLMEHLIKMSRRLDYWGRRI